MLFLIFLITFVITIYYLKKTRDIQYADALDKQVGIFRDRYKTNSLPEFFQKLSMADAENYYVSNADSYHRRNGLSKLCIITCAFIGLYSALLFLVSLSASSLFTTINSMIENKIQISFLFSGLLPLIMAGISLYAWKYLIEYQGKIKNLYIENGIEEHMLINI